ncbi:MAG: hypothetical protein IPL96_12940 [Holophagaceae bacterium]|nr:hypothetical protein [Holophagaceae bacterium]
MDQIQAEAVPGVEVSEATGSWIAGRPMPAMALPPPTQTPCMMAAPWITSSAPTQGRSLGCTLITRVFVLNWPGVSWPPISCCARIVNDQLDASSRLRTESP